MSDNKSLYSEDLAPIPQEKRKWNTWNYAALWISMSLCIPTYMLASSLISGGMNWWEAILTIFVGNTVVLIPMILNGHAGAKYGIPFPVLARASFGVSGANIPAMLRAVVACGWFGIQTWIGGFAIYLMIKVWMPSIEMLPQIFPESFGLQTGPAITFFLFWLLNMYVVYLGVDSIRKLLVFKAFFLPIAALALLFWAINAGHGLGPILSQPSKFTTNAEFWNYFFPGLTGMVGFWATLSLNIPDFTRYAKSQRAQITGQAIGLPPSMTLFSFIGVVVTSATFIIYGETIWDPLVLAGKFESKLLVSVAMICVTISTLATNIAANIVSPANDFANLSPSKINFRTGGYITGIIGILIFPWKLIADPNGYIFTWLIAYSSLLGPVGGIMIADYFFIRQKNLITNDLYSHKGIYNYTDGFNRAAIIALLLGILPNVPGFLVTINAIPKDYVPEFISHLYNYAWFVGFAVSFFIYLILMKRKTVLLAGVFLLFCNAEKTIAQSKPSAAFSNGKWIDLTYSFSDSTLYWPNNKITFHLDTLFNGITDKGFYYSSNQFCAPEHGGTHLDAPIHFAVNHQTVDQVPISNLTGDGIVIDVSANALMNRDYLVSINDIQKWEKQNGTIPDHSILLFRTGYGKFYPDAEKYFGTKMRGQEAVTLLHFPGLDPEAASWLIKNRKIKAVGLDTPSIDYGQSKEFKSHQVLLGENIPVFENVANLDLLPVKGAYIIALPMKIYGGSGSPVRIVAWIEK